MLAFEAVTFDYRRQQRVIAGLDLDVSSRRVVLLGPNGAGKTTLLKLGCGALQPNSGTVVVGDATSDTRTGRRQIASLVGYMPQDVRPLTGLTILEQVAYAGWLRGLSRRESGERAIEAVRAVGLERTAGAQSSQVSGGQLRRVGIAQILVAKSEIILLDEPSAGLDPAERARLRGIIADLDRPVVVSTHLVDDVEESFDTVVILAHGRVAYQGSTTAFLRHANRSEDPGGSRSDRASPAEAAYLNILQSTTD